MQSFRYSQAAGFMHISFCQWKIHADEASFDLAALFEEEAFLNESWYRSLSTKKKWLDLFGFDLASLLPVQMHCGVTDPPNAVVESRSTPDIAVKLPA